MCYIGLLLTTRRLRTPHEHQHRNARRGGGAVSDKHNIQKSQEDEAREGSSDHDADTVESAHHGGDLRGEGVGHLL